MNAQTQRNMMAAGLPVALSEGSMTGTLSLTERGHQFKFFGGDGKVRHLESIPFMVRTPRKRGERKNGRVTIIRPQAS